MANLTNRIDFVYIFDVKDGNPKNTSVQYYPANSLTGEKVTDEDGHFVETYRDLLGNVVLERRNGITYSDERKEARGREELPKCALLSLETPRCWHWSLYYDGTFYDPEHGVLDDFPVCNPLRIRNI